MVEFDRGGDDVVIYDYNGKKWEKALRNVGYKIGLGAFSDISYLEHLKCKGVNIGVGYKEYHSLDAYADIEVWLENVIRFKKFYSQNKKKYYHHEHQPLRYPYRDDFYYDHNYHNENYQWQYYSQENCYICGDIFDIDDYKSYILNEQFGLTEEEELTDDMLIKLEDEAKRLFEEFKRDQVCLYCK
jgi:hypothetical protein